MEDVFAFRWSKLFNLEGRSLGLLCTSFWMGEKTGTYFFSGKLQW